MLILPDHPYFADYLNSLPPPPGWRDHQCSDQEVALISCSDTGLLRPATKAELFDYAYGGEYDEYLENFGEDDDFEEE